MKIQLQNNVTECMFEKQYIEKQINKVNDKVFNPHAYNVEISDEGYSLYRKQLSELDNSLQATNEHKSLDKELLSKAIIDITGLTQSNFHSQFKKLNTQTKKSKENKEDCDSIELDKNCFQVYCGMYDEIKQGYADGTREIWILDESSESGFRKVTEEEELEALDSAFGFYSQVVDAYVNSGMKNRETIADAVNEWQAFNQNKEYVSKQKIEDTDETTKDLRNRLINASNAWKKGYSINGSNLLNLFNQIFKDNFMVEIMPNK